MTISKKHFINIAKIIDDNSKHNDDDKQGYDDDECKMFARIADQAAGAAWDKAFKQ